MRENQPAIASILWSHGGLSGQNEQLAEAQRLHKEARNEFLMQKGLRREKKLALFNKRVELLGRLLEVYKIMSEQLPALSKYINLLR